MYPNGTTQGGGYSSSAMSGIKVAENRFEPSTPKLAALDDARQQVEDFITQVREVAGSLTNYGDMALGAVPQDTPSVGVNSAESGPRVMMLSIRLSQLRDAINELRSAANRIHAI